MSTPRRPRRIQILKAGRHTTRAGHAIEFSQADLASAAAAYDPATHEAPVVVGHPKTDDPAFGWVTRLAAQGGTLEAEVDQLNPEFTEAVKAGAFKHVSAAFYAPGAPENPKPGTYYLRHVGFLGAQPPAVKGLRAVELAEGAEPVEVEVELAEVETDVAPAAVPDQAPESTPSSTEIQPRDEKPSEPAEPVNPTQDASELEPGSDTQTASTPPAAEADRAAELEAREKALAEREARVAAAEAAAKRAGVSEFAEGLVKAGRLLPRDRVAVVELMLALPAVPIEFAEGGTQRSVEPATLLRSILERLPVQVDFAERSAGAGASAVDTADPQAIAQAAEELMSTEAREGRHLSPAAAVRRVLGARR